MVKRARANLGQCREGIVSSRSGDTVYFKHFVAESKYLKGGSLKRPNAH